MINVKEKMFLIFETCKLKLEFNVVFVKVENNFVVVNFSLKKCFVGC